MAQRDDKEARRARARALRERVAKILRGEKSPTEKESPRDFVHRRMRELAESAKKRSAGPTRTRRKRSS